MELLTRTRVAPLTVLGLLAISLAACGELAHSNPVDPEGKVIIDVAGPTEIHSLGQEVKFTYTSVPEWTFSAPRWESSAPDVLGLATAGGIFVSRSNGDALVTVRLGPHTADPIPVRVIQIAAGVTVRTCDGSPASMRSIGIAIPICAFIRDSIGSQVSGTPQVSVASTDTAVVALSAGSAIGRNCGSAYIRADTASWKDSLLVQVCQ
jgi:hypothetical protein